MFEAQKLDALSHQARKLQVLQALQVNLERTLASKDRMYEEKDVRLSSLRILRFKS